MAGEGEWRLLWICGFKLDLLAEGVYIRYVSMILSLDLMLGCRWSMGVDECNWETRSMIVVLVGVGFRRIKFKSTFYDKVNVYHKYANTNYI